MPRCLVVQHVHPESPYAIGEALAAHGIDVDLRRVHLGEPLPLGLEQHDGVVVMGGPMSAAHDDGFPSRQAELTLLAEALDRRLPTLGVCLGAQLLALAAGGEVLPGAAGAEIGWGPVTISPDAGDDPLLSGLPATLEVFHWHSDTFSVPADAAGLASNRRYANQAFRVGSAAWGLQFHLEVDAVGVRAMVDAFPEDLLDVPSGAVDLLAATTGALGRLAPYRDQVLGAYASLVSVGAGLRQDS
jgi:GMP synthase-like glutamine amidotransferase